MCILTLHPVMRCSYCALTENTFQKGGEKECRRWSGEECCQWESLAKRSQEPEELVCDVWAEN